MYDYYTIKITNTAGTFSGLPKRANAGPLGPARETPNNRTCVRLLYHDYVGVFLGQFIKNNPFIDEELAHFFVYAV